MTESETTMPEAAIIVNASAFIDLSASKTIFFAKGEHRIMAVIAQGEEAAEEIERAGVAPTILMATLRVERLSGMGTTLLQSASD